MERVRETLTGLAIGTLIYAIPVGIIGLLISGDKLKFTFGFLLGLFVSSLLIIHMTYCLERALERTSDEAKSYMRIRSLFRYAVMFAALASGFLLEEINFIAVLLGLLSIKFAAQLTPYILKRLYPDEYITKEEAYMYRGEDDESEEQNNNDPKVRDSRA